MRKKLQCGAAALAVLFTVALGAEAAAQDTTTAPAATAQDKINPSADQAAAFLKNLEDMAVQVVQGLQQPTVGAKVPPDVKTTPMPSDAATTLPDAKDHHVVKSDDDTVLIVDPLTREIVSVITAMEGGSQQNTAAPAADTNK
jgi:hypothetical protein